MGQSKFIGSKLPIMTEVCETRSAPPEWNFNALSKPEDVPLLLRLLNDPVEENRYGAAYALGFRYHDARVVRPLIRVLTNRQETPRVRGQAAESLRSRRTRKALKALIECSADESAEVRFWSVFSLGQYSGRRKKTRLAVVRALEQRLHDDGWPNWGWTVGLEALAMLESKRRHPAATMFCEKIFAVLRDPLNHADEWQWVQGYWDVRSLRS